MGNQLSEAPEVSDTHLPFKERRLPAYISLNIKGIDDATTKSSEDGTSSSLTEGRLPFNKLKLYPLTTELQQTILKMSRQFYFDISINESIIIDYS